jgi:adenine deaminase
MAEAGMDFRHILASLTTAPAERFGETSRLGRIAAGLTADLVVLGEAPSTDVRAFAAVRYTIRNGKIIYKAPSARPAGTQPNRSSRNGSPACDYLEGRLRDYDRCEGGRRIEPRRLGERSDRYG